MSDLEREKKILEELVKARKAVKRKYDLLRNEKYNTEHALSEAFKPITAPLEKLVFKKRKIERKKEEPFDDDDADDNDDDDDDEIETLQPHDNSSVNEHEKSFEEKEIKTDNDEDVVLVGSERDKIYGIRKEGNRYKIGTAIIRFKKNQIQVNDIVFPRTVGLFDLNCLQ